MNTNERKVRYGWNADGTKNEAQQRVIQVLQEMRARRFPLELIADCLNKMGVPTQRGGEWHASTVRSVLSAVKLGPLTEVEEKLLEKHFSWQEVQQLLQDGYINMEDWQEDEEGHLEDKGYFLTLEEALEEAPHMSREQVEQIVRHMREMRELATIEGRPQFSFQCPDIWFAKGRGRQTADPEYNGEKRAGVVDEIVRQLTARCGREAHEWVDQITGQPTVKRKLRVEVNKLLEEIAVQRQMNLWLRARLAEMGGT